MLCWVGGAGACYAKKQKKKSRFPIVVKCCCYRQALVPDDNVVVVVLDSFAKAKPRVGCKTASKIYIMVQPLPGTPGEKILLARYSIQNRRSGNAEVRKVTYEMDLKGWKKSLG